VNSMSVASRRWSHGTTCQKLAPGPECERTRDSNAVSSVLSEPICADVTVLRYCLYALSLMFIQAFLLRKAWCTDVLAAVAKELPHVCRAVADWLFPQVVESAAVPCALSLAGEPLGPSGR
jgi:hypothetical protein